MSIRFKKVISILLAVLLLLPSSFLAPVVEASDDETEIVWTLDAGSLGVPGTTGDGEYLQSSNGSYQPGVQLADMSSSSMQMYEGGVLGINPSGGTYKAINIQTGTAVGGTNYYYNQGFVAEANVEYTVTFSVYVADGNGQVRVRGNGASADWQSTNINTTPSAVSYTWTQSASGGNLQIDTGNTDQGKIVYITDLQIAKLIPAPVYTEVWALDADSLGVPGTTGDGEYLQSSNGSYQPGVQLADMSSSSMQMYEGGVLGINPSGGTYKAINIQTGTAVGGTNYYYNQGFVAEANVEYTVTFSVYVADGNGQVRVRGNGASADWQTTDITTTPSAVSYTWTQSANGGNLQIDTGNTAQGKIVYITDLQISALEASTPSPGSDEVVVAYDLQEDANLLELMNNGGNDYLVRAGSPALTPITTSNGKIALEISNRTEDWNGVDVKASAIGLQNGAEYSVELTGYIPEDVAIPDGAEIVLGVSSDPWPQITAVDATPSFTINYEGTWDSGSGIRIQASAAITTFVIDSLIVSVQGGIEMPRKPLPTVPGVVIAQEGVDGAAYTGATIVLGTDKTVWPYSSNSLEDTPVAAFTPEEDATYYLTFNVTSNGTTGFRVRWFHDVGFGPTTAADDLHVNDNIYAADEVATIVPAYFQSTIESGETKDYEVAFTMSGSEGPDGLIGNIGIRGQFGNHSFTINSLKVTDEDGNVLVEWSNTAEPFIPDDYEWPASAWDLTLPSLKEAYSDYFLIGNILGWGGNPDATPWGQENDQADQAIKDASIIEQTEAMFKAQYNAVTAENVMKPDNISSAKDVYNYTAADKFVDWAQANDIAVIGHTLIWHSQSPAWLNKGDAANRESAKENLENYIANVAGHFKDKVIVWDVVNEAFSDNTASFDGSDWTTALRKDSPWYVAYANGADESLGESGADYIYDAFVATRLADPNATLYYNDYNETYKYEQIAQMAESLNAKWAEDERNTDPDRKLIEGIGMQSHFWIGSLPDVQAEAVETVIERFIQAGLRISVSELDIPFAGNNNYHLDEERQEEQAELYGILFGIYKRYADHIDRVSFWGKADIQSWRASGMPLLFDNSYRPKAAFWTVIELGKTVRRTGSDTDPETPTPTQPGVVEATVTEDGRATVGINEEQFNSALDHAQDGRLEFVVTGSENASSVSVTLPLDQVKGAADAGISVVAVDTGIATLELPLSLFADQSGEVELSVSKVDVSTLSPEAQEKVGNNPVFDFNLSVGGVSISSFGNNQQVRVSYPYTLPEDQQAGQIVIYYIADNGQLEVIKNGRYNPETGMVEFKTKHFSKYTAVPVAVRFADLNELPWARDSIAALAAREIVSGVSADSFLPRKETTRAEFVQMLVQALDLQGGDTANVFSDVKAGAWYEASILTAYELGIVFGKTDGTFGVHDSISRQDMAVMVFRALKAAGITLEPSQAAAAFDDEAAIAGYAADAVSAVQQAGLLEEVSGGSFAPKATVNRALAATVLNRLLNKLL